MPKPKIQSPAEARLREFGLSFPEAREEFPWDHRAIKVKGKMFVILSWNENIFGITVKLPESGRFALTQPFAERTGYGLGKSGWVSARFGDAEEVPVDLLEQWIDESYRAVAPKRLVARLDKDEGTTEPARPTCSTRKRKGGKKTGTK